MITSFRLNYLVIVGTLALLQFGCLKGNFKSAKVQEITQNSIQDPLPLPETVPAPQPSPQPNPQPQPQPQPQPSPSTLTPALMATGHFKTSMYSCDGGESWRGYRTSSTTTRCWEGPGAVECDHTSLSNRGLAYGPQGFVASFGWGSPGSVELFDRSAKSWQTVQSGNTWAGVAYGSGVYILNERQPLVSSNATAWNRGGDINFRPWNARRIYFVNQQNGFFVSVANSGDDHDLMISTNNGQSWSRPTTLPSQCGNGRLAHDSQSTLVLSSAALCVSTDSGRTWRTLSGLPANSQNLIYDGSEFKLYHFGRVYRSANGINWTNQLVTLNGRTSAESELGLLEYQPTLRKYVLIAQSWGRFYELTKYYHSLDGINFIETTNAPRTPHPMVHISSGFIENCQ